VAGPLTGAGGEATGPGGGDAGGGITFSIVGCGVDGTAVAPLIGGAPVVACETTSDGPSGAEPAGHRGDVGFALAAGCATDFVALPAGQRDVAFASALRFGVTALSAGQRDVAFASSSPTIPPGSAVAFGRAGFTGAGAGARARASRAAALLGSKRGGSVGLLT